MRTGEEQYLLIISKFQYTTHYLAPIGQVLEPDSFIHIDIETSIIISDVTKNTGYNLLYGSNADVGGYKISGTVTKEIDGTVIYDMNYTFNDIMDPNFNICVDRVRYAGLSFLKTFNPNISLQDYNASISWSDRTTINPDGTGKEGWLKDMTRYDSLDMHINNDQLNANLYVGWFQGREKKVNAKALEEHMKIRAYINSHPEYYKCPAE